MTHHKSYKNESQDARRRDQQRDAHPYETEKKDKQHSRISTGSKKQK